MIHTYVHYTCMDFETYAWYKNLMISTLSTLVALSYDDYLVPGQACTYINIVKINYGMENSLNIERIG